MLEGNLWFKQDYPEEVRAKWDDEDKQRWQDWKDKKDHHPRCHGSRWDACGCTCNCGFDPTKNLMKNIWIDNPITKQYNWNEIK